VSAYSSYPGNLPKELEQQKLMCLSRGIASAFNAQPAVYLAGRYGFGANTLSILQALDYRVDLSGVAMADFSHDGGPNYSAWSNDSFWDGQPRILRIPHSAAQIGFCCWGGRCHRPPSSSLPFAAHLRGILARCGAVRRVRLSPEGVGLRQLKACARALCASGARFLLFSLHSPSIRPGCTPYVRDRDDLEAFTRRIDGFLAFVRDELGGTFATPLEALQMAERWS
jgi:hypothetical protein